MSSDIIIVLIILTGAVILFITEKLPVDLVALMALALLFLTGILTAEEGLKGFSDDATITIAAMFIISAGLFQTGLVNYIGRLVVRIFKYNFWTATVLTLITAGIVSAFINNTPVVAIFLPILLQVARDTGTSPSKLLMPLSFASIFGGVCTLLGTSTNILVNSLAVQKGEPAFTMFEFTPVGLLFFAAGIIYMIVIGIRLMPQKPPAADLAGSYKLGDYLTEILVKEDSGDINIPLKETFLVKKLEVDVLEIIRGEEKIFLPSPSFRLRADDVLRVKCSVEKIKELQQRDDFDIQTGIKWQQELAEAPDLTLIEAVIAPGSILTGKTLKQINFRYRFGAVVLALRHRGRVMYENVSTTKLIPGDALLIQVDKENEERVRDNDSFVVVSQIESPTFIKLKIFTAVTILLLVVLAATFDFMPIAIAALSGSVLMVLTRCITLEQAYRAVDWKIVMLLAGSISLGIALEKTGAARLIAEFVAAAVGPYGDIAVLSAFYLLTLILTEAMSNNATAAVITPIAIVTAHAMGADPRPFLVAVMFAASLAFMSPIGYQTHLLVYNAGRYTIKDFLKAGTPLNILFWLMATFLIPVFFPFR